MKITLLCENSASDMCWLAEWGFSAYIQHNGVSILFDAGYSDIYKRNAKRAWINLNDANFIVLSHFHDDHSRGLQFHEFSERKKIILHPRILKVMPEGEALNIINDFEVLETDTPFEFSKDVFYLGSIPRVTSFEKGDHEGDARINSFGKGDYESDAMPDDLAIAIKTDNGCVIVTGCSHSGICNICEQAKKVTGQKIYAVLGGFHLFDAENYTFNQTIEYFKKENPQKIFPMHCVSFPALVKFHTTFGCQKYSAGDTINL